MRIIVRGAARPPWRESTAIDRELEIEFIQELGCSARLQRILTIRVWGRDQEFDSFCFCVNYHYMCDHRTRDQSDHATIRYAFVQFFFHGDGCGHAAVIEEITANTDT